MSLKRAIVLACAGALLPCLFPLYVWTLSHRIANPVVFLEPLAWVLFFLPLHAELAGNATPLLRRIHAAVSSVLMLASGIWLAWQVSIILQSFALRPGAVVPFDLRINQYVDVPVILGWALLFATFSALAKPLAHRLPAVLAALLLAGTLASGLPMARQTVCHWWLATPGSLTPLRVAMGTLQILGWMLICPFLLELALGWGGRTGPMQAPEPGRRGNPR